MRGTDLDESGLPRNRLWQPTTVKWFAVIFGASLLYGVVRYHFVKDVAWDQFPLFILNKILSLAAVFFIASSYLVGRVFKWHNDDKVMRLVVVKFCGLMGFVMAGAHAFMSVVLMRPAYFAKYFGTPEAPEDTPKGSSSLLRRPIDGPDSGHAFAQSLELPALLLRRPAGALLARHRAAAHQALELV